MVQHILLAVDMQSVVKMQHGCSYIYTQPVDYKFYILALTRKDLNLVSYGTYKSLGLMVKFQIYIKHSEIKIHQ